MKLGYSMLLGEYIDAEAVEYGDCTQFQIICPGCKEPVFKVVRDATQLLHYLSHYNKSKAYAAECELRIKGITKEQIKKSDWFSREQRLKYFLSVFKEMLIETSGCTGDSRNKLMTKLKVWQKSKVMCLLRDYAYDDMKDILKTDQVFIADSYEYWIEEYNRYPTNPLKTGFSISVQKRIATDFIKHVCSIKARENFDFIFNFAFMWLLSGLAQRHGTVGISESENILASYMNDLLNASLNKGKLLLSEMCDVPFVYSDGRSDNMLEKMGHEIVECIFGLLLRLRYFDYLKRVNG